jgi:hypothetical protein
MTKTKMNIAILVSGPPRFNKDLNDFIKNIQGIGSADWFFYLNNNNNLPDKPNPDYKRLHIADSWRYCTNEDWARNKIQSNLPENHHVVDLQFYDHEQVNIPQDGFVTRHIWRMHHHWKQVDLMRQAEEARKGQKYDLVIRARSDMGIDRVIDLQSIKNSGYVEVPRDNWHGNPSICDLMGIGTSEQMSVYCDLFNHSLDYVRKGKCAYHPESLLACHLQENQIPYRATGWNYVIWTSVLTRSDGTEYYDFGTWE